MRLYSPKLMKKPMVIVANKMDLTGAEDALKVLKKKWKKSKIFPISGVTGKGLDELLAFAAKEAAKPEVIEEEPESLEPMKYVVELDFEVKPDDDGTFRISGAKVEKLAAMTNFNQSEGLRRFQNILKKMGVEKELARQGAEPGDTIRLGKLEFFFELDDEKPRNLPSKRPYKPTGRKSGQK